MKYLYLILLLITYSLNAQEDATVSAVEFASGLDKPVDIKNAGDSRLFVVEQSGSIQIVTSDGVVNSTPFLSINVNDNGNEQGMLGIAFHPDYATNGFFYVNYIKSDNSTQISRFTVSSNPDIADANSELDILNVDQPFSNHNGGCMQFGPDGYLYIGLGDGGSGGDPGNRAQNPQTPLGKMLRIDVDTQSNGNNYGIPADNPFVNTTSTLDEIWALGLRNPWKFSFDAQTGDLWIADVGQNEIEEVNKVSGNLGGLNYGWRCYEGDAPFNTAGCPDDNTLTFPIVDYAHSGNGAFKCSVTGGYVYRGTDYPGMQGLYIFADFCSDEIATINSTGELTFVNEFPGGLSSFGEDVTGELYVAQLGAGKILRIIDENLGVEEISDLSITLSPNPSGEVVTFTYPAFAKAETLTLFDLNGRSVLNQNINSTETAISVGHLSQGIYIARMSSSPQIIKLVVQ